MADAPGPTEAQEEQYSRAYRAAKGAVAAYINGRESAYAPTLWGRAADSVREAQQLAVKYGLPEAESDALAEDIGA